MSKIIAGSEIRMIWFVFIILISVIFLAPKIPAQHTVPASDEADLLFQEGMRLSQAGTAESSEKALVKLEEARKLYHSSGNKQGEGMALILMGNINKRLGKKLPAIDAFQKAYQLYKETDRIAGQGMVLHSLGSIYHESGDFPRAVDTYREALILQEKRGNYFDQIGLNNSLGNIFADLGELDKALDYYDKAIRLSQQTPDGILGNLTTLTNIALIYLELGEYEEALNALKLTSAWYETSGNEAGQALIYFTMADLNLKAGNLKESLKFSQVALTLFEKMGNEKGEANVLNLLGGLYLSMGEKEKSLTSLQNAVTLHYLSESNFDTPFTLGMLMQFWASQGNKNLSIFWGKAAVNQYQKLRQSFNNLDKQAQRSYLKRIEPFYRKLAGLLIEQKRMSEAVEVLNAFKDQQFYDFNNTKPLSGLVHTKREGVLLGNFEKLAKNITDLGLKIDAVGRDSTQRNELKTRLDKAISDSLAFFKQAETEFSLPADEKDAVSAVPDLVQFQSALRSLDQPAGQKAVAVYQLVGEENFSALIVSADGVKAISTHFKNSELNKKAVKLWGLLQSAQYDTTILSQQIYEVVFKPLEKELPPGTTTILWSLDGNLHYLPMAALWDGKQFLAERFKHVILTRADSERLTRNPHPNWTGTGFGSSKSQKVKILGEEIGFSSLPGVTRELQSIFTPDDRGQTLIKGETLSDQQFTKESFYRALKQNRPLVHISSHFSFRPGDEARSFLLLGDGSALTLNELKEKTELFKGVDLLTLSACNTAATQADANGREIDGFAELAQRLGAGAVMATLWPVSDASTPWLMKEFYENRQTGGLNKAEALQKAQIALLKGTAEVKELPEGTKSESGKKIEIVIEGEGASREEADRTRNSEKIYLKGNEAPPYQKEGKARYAHPYYWSAFVLYGNWK